MFASLSCKGRGVVAAFRGSGSATALCFRLAIGGLTWLVLGRGSSARFSPDGASLQPAGFSKRVLLLCRAVHSSKGGREGGGSIKRTALRAKLFRRALNQQQTLLTKKLVISRNVLQGFPVARYAGSSHVFPRPTTVEWCRVVAPSFVLTG